MAKTDTEQRLQQLEEQNRRMAQMLGLSTEPAVSVTERADYIEHGSEKHQIFLGLIEVLPDELEDAKLNKYVLYESPNTKRVWRLEDELTITQAFPTLDPEKVALMTLRQKVSSLESGRPPIPADAPPLLVPISAV